jgi:hypothetical protein
MVGAGAPRGVGAPVSAAEPSPGQLRPAVVRPSLVMCGRTWPGAAVPCSCSMLVPISSKMCICL